MITTVNKIVFIIPQPSPVAYAASAPQGKPMSGEDFAQLGGLILLAVLLGVMLARGIIWLSDRPTLRR